MQDTRTRTLELDRTRGDDGTFPVTLSTETPALREFGYEVLDHSRADLSRAPLPLIESHDLSTLNIGIVEQLRVEGKKLRGSLRLGKSARAKEIAEDIREGITRSVSIGYTVADPVDSGEQDGYPIYRFGFTPVELSLVAAPMDINAGIGRSYTMENTQEKMTRSERKRESNALELERQRTNQILAIGRENDCLELAQRCVTEGDSVADFQAAVLEKMQRQNRTDELLGANAFGMDGDSSYLGRSADSISMRDLILTQANPRKYEGGLVREVSADIERRMGRQTEGLFFPLGELSTRSTTYGGTGSNLVSTDLRSGEFIDLLRNETKAIEAGASMLTGLEGNQAIPLGASGSSGYWIAGDDADSITASDPGFGQKTIEPHFLGHISKASLRMLTQSSPGIENLIRQDHARGISVEMDRAALNGSGSGAEPLGLLGTTGVDSNTSASATPTFQELVALETAVNAANAPRSSRGYMMTPTTAGALKSTEVVSSTGIMIFRSDDGSDGIVNGSRTHVSANVPADTAIYGDWSQLVIGMWGGLEILVNPYDAADFAKGTVSIRSILTCDFMVRYPTAFSFTAPA